MTPRKQVSVQITQDMKTQGNAAPLRITNPTVMASNGNVMVKSQANNSEGIKERTCSMG